METWHNRLKRLRNARPKLSQAKVAGLVGIKPSSVAQWEIGRSKPTIDKLPRLAELYHVSLQELCGDDLPLIDIAAAGAGFQRRHDGGQTIEQQIAMLSRAWLLLTEGERDGLAAAIEAMIAPRRKTV